MSSAASRGPKLLKLGIFHENGLFHSYFFLLAMGRMSCHILLERTDETEKNGICMIKICSYLMKILTFQPVPVFHDMP